MFQGQEGTHMNWTCSLFSCWTPQKDNICVPQHDKGWCWKTIFIKNHWNAQALDINSDGYISKQELMIASQVSLNIQNTPIVFIISSRQQCHFQPICFYQRTGRRLSKTEVDATFREYDHNKVICGEDNFGWDELVFIRSEWNGGRIKKQVDIHMEQKEDK